MHPGERGSTAVAITLLVHMTPGLPKHASLHNHAPQSTAPSVACSFIHAVETHSTPRCGCLVVMVHDAIRCPGRIHCAAALGPDAFQDTHRISQNAANFAWNISSGVEAPNTLSSLLGVLGWLRKASSMKGRSEQYPRRTCREDLQHARIKLLTQSLSCPELARGRGARWSAELGSQPYENAVQPRCRSASCSGRLPDSARTHFARSYVTMLGL